MVHKKSVVIAWNEIPAHAAYNIKELIGKEKNINFRLLSTRTRLPFPDAEKITGTEIIWVDYNQKLRWSDIGLSVPDVFIARLGVSCLEFTSRRWSQTGHKSCCFCG